MQPDRPKYEQLVAVLNGPPLEVSASWFRLQSRDAADAVHNLQRQHDALEMRPGRSAAQRRARIGQQIYHHRRVLRAYQEAAVEAEVAEGVRADRRTAITEKSLDEQEAEQGRGRRTLHRLRDMRQRERRRFHGMTLAAIRDLAYLDPRRRERQISPVGVARRTNARSGRPGGQPKRQTTRSGADSGDSGDEGPSQAPPPQLAGTERRGLYSFGCSTCPACGHVLLFADGELLCPKRNCVSWGRSTSRGDAR
jgi:hypothetical protein